MDHLRRLAPPRQPDGTRAVAVVPSRFLNLNPLRVSPTTSPWRSQFEEEQATRTGIGDNVPDFHQMQAPLRSASMHSHANDAAMRGHADATSSLRARIGTATLNVAASEGFAQERGSHLSSPATSDAASHRSRSNARDAGGKDVGASAQVRSLPDDKAVATMVTRPAATAYPISETSRVNRTHAAATERPVIEVTIDRIEVRAPSSHHRQPAATKSRATMPGESLSDYLAANRSRPSRDRS